MGKGGCKFALFWVQIDVTKIQFMKIAYLLLVSLFISCSQISEKDSQDIVEFNELLNMDELSRIKVWNNKGMHMVTGEKFEELVEKLSSMTLVKDQSFKLGGKSLELLVDGEEFVLYGATNSIYLEISSDIVSQNKDLIGESDVLYFKIEGFNIDSF